MKILTLEWAITEEHCDFYGDWSPRSLSVHMHKKWFLSTELSSPQLSECDISWAQISSWTLKYCFGELPLITCCKQGYTRSFLSIKISAYHVQTCERESRIHYDSTLHTSSKWTFLCLQPNVHCICVFLKSYYTWSVYGIGHISRVCHHCESFGVFANAMIG